MNRSEYICAYYGAGPNFAERLRQLRVMYPEARVCAMVPAGHELTEGERACVDEVVHTAQAHYSPAQVRECIELVRDIRRRRFDRFIVTYPTVQLRVLASLSGAKRCECWAYDHRIVRLNSWPAFVLPGRALRAAWGCAMLARAAVSVALRPVRR